MNFLNQLLRGIAFIPSLVNGIEELFSCKTGLEKKDAAMSFLESALATVDAVACREIVDPVRFRNGISKIIDGTVDCLNASMGQGRPAAAGRQFATVTYRPRGETHLPQRTRRSTESRKTPRWDLGCCPFNRFLRSTFPGSFSLGP
jgi:hypothetical protein